MTFNSGRCYWFSMRTFLLILLFLKSASTLALINGAPLTGENDIVRIRLTNGWVCSGVFIDPYTILTAAHCISPAQNTEKLQVNKIESATELILDLEVKKLIPHPDYSAQYWPSYDIALIKTTKNSKFEGHFQLQNIMEGRSKEVILFGCGKTDYEKKSYSRTTGENSILQIGAVLFFVGESNVGKSKIGMNVSVAPNDSGGPILDKVTGKIIAVMTTTTLKNSLRYGISTLSTGTSTTVEANFTFIESNLGEKNNEQ